MVQLSPEPSRQLNETEDKVWESKECEGDPEDAVMAVLVQLGNTSLYLNSVLNEDIA